MDLAVHGLDWERYSGLLEDEERARAARFVTPELRRHFTTTRGVLRILAGQKLDRPPSSIRFQFSSHGKPSLRDSEGVFFNVAHSGSRALVAFSTSDVGVDIEHIRPFPEPMNLVRRFFSRGELAEFEKVEAKDAESLFFKCWTRKEAFVKALGHGLSMGFDSFTVPLDENCSDAPLIQDPTTPGRRWKLIPLEFEDGYEGAIVVDPSATTIHRRSWQRISSFVQ